MKNRGRFSGRVEIQRRRWMNLQTPVGVIGRCRRKGHGPAVLFAGARSESIRINLSIKVSYRLKILRAARSPITERSTEKNSLSSLSRCPAVETCYPSERDGSPLNKIRCNDRISDRARDIRIRRSRRPRTRGSLCSLSINETNGMKIRDPRARPRPPGPKAAARRQSFDLNVRGAERTASE